MAVVVIGEVKEGSKSWITVSFASRTTTPTAPSTAHYRIDCKTTGTVITSLTTLTPASSIEIPISGTENRIIDQSNHEESRELTVFTTFNSGQDEANSAVRYTVENLRYVT